MSTEKLQHQETITQKIEKTKNTTEQVELKTWKIAWTEIWKKAWEIIKEKIWAKKAWEKLKWILHQKEWVNGKKEKVSEKISWDMEVFKSVWNITAVELWDNINKKMLDLSEKNENITNDDYEKAKKEVIDSLDESELQDIFQNRVWDLNRKINDSEWSDFETSIYDKLKEKSPKLKYIEESTNSKLTKELLATYWKEKLESFFSLLEQLKTEWKKIPDSLGEFDKLIVFWESENNKKDEQNEWQISKQNTVKDKIINNRTNNNWKEISNIAPLRNWTNSINSYNWNSYKTTSSISEDVNVDNIDSEIKSLSKVNNISDDMDLLEWRWLSEHNKELIFNRIPKEWFDVAIAFVLKEWKDIRKDTPISLASRSKKVWLISYPNWTSEETPIINADKSKNPPKTDIIDTVFHFNWAKIWWINKSAALSYNSKTTLWASIQSPEWQAEWGKWWHWVADSRFPNWKTFWCVWIRQEIAIRLARSVQNSWWGYWYLVS